MSSLLVFKGVYRLEIQSIMLVFSTQPCERSGGGGGGPNSDEGTDTMVLYRYIYVYRRGRRRGSVGEVVGRIWARI